MLIYQYLKALPGRLRCSSKTACDLREDVRNRGLVSIIPGVLAYNQNGLRGTAGFEVPVEEWAVPIVEQLPE
jgi:hypothetical protein